MRGIGILGSSRTLKTVFDFAETHAKAVAFCRDPNHRRDPGRHDIVASHRTIPAVGRDGKEEYMKIVAVLYPCPEDATTVGPEEVKPPMVLGCADSALGLRDWLEGQGHELVVTTDRGEGDELYQELQDAEVLITTPFWPVYVTGEIMDLAEAANRNITVAEQTGSNITSVAEHAVMQILTLVRNYIPAYKDVVNGGWS